MYCSELRCKRKPVLGAHVQRKSTNDKDWYIVPLCAQHNRQTGRSLELLADAALVRAKLEVTCGKKAIGVPMSIAFASGAANVPTTLP